MQWVYPLVEDISTLIHSYRIASNVGIRVSRLRYVTLLLGTALLTSRDTLSAKLTSLHVWTVAQLSLLVLKIRIVCRIWA